MRRRVGNPVRAPSPRREADGRTGAGAARERRRGHAAFLAMRWWWLWLVCGCDRLLGLSTVKPIDAAIDSPYPPYVNAVLADHPVGYFRLDETIGVDAIDLTGGT